MVQQVVQIEATLVRMNQNWRMLWRIQGIWWKVFEGVGQVERLVGDGGEVLGGAVQGGADDDGRGDYGGAVGLLAPSQRYSRIEREEGCRL